MPISNAKFYSGIKNRLASRRLTRNGEGGTLHKTLAQWLVEQQSQAGREKCTWMGVPAYKNPLDLWIYQEILYETRPDVVVEIGSYAGGSTMYLASVLEMIGSGIVVAIDMDRAVYKAAHDRIVTVTGNSSSEPVVNRVTGLCEGKKVMVIHDGDHNRAQVLDDLRHYAPLVSVGNYLVVEDGISDQMQPGLADGHFGDFPDGGPLVAIREFLDGNDEFVVDSTRERYVLTQNPHGFLKRVT
ncbi:MAG: CmcI family methyltransferase [Candidatus Geothermincolia bacterium]